MAGKDCLRILTTIHPNGPSCQPTNFRLHRPRQMNECANTGKLKKEKLFSTGKETACAPKKITVILRCWWIGRFRRAVIAAFMSGGARKSRYGTRKVRANLIRRM